MTCSGAQCNALYHEETNKSTGRPKTSIDTKPADVNLIAGSWASLVKQRSQSDFDESEFGETKLKPMSLELSVKLPFYVIVISSITEQWQ